MGRRTQNRQIRFKVITLLAETLPVVQKSLLLLNRPTPQLIQADTPPPKQQAVLILVHPIRLPLLIFVGPLVLLVVRRLWFPDTRKEIVGCRLKLNRHRVAILKPRAPPVIVQLSLLNGATPCALEHTAVRQTPPVLHPSLVAYVLVPLLFVVARPIRLPAWLEEAHVVLVSKFTFKLHAAERF